VCVCLKRASKRCCQGPAARTLAAARARVGSGEGKAVAAEEEVEDRRGEQKGTGLSVSAFSVRWKRTRVRTHSHTHMHTHKRTHGSTCPSPHVNSRPSASMAAVWVGPTLMRTTRTPGPHESGSNSTRLGMAQGKRPPWPNCPDSPRPQVYLREPTSVAKEL